jgi:hypothetical protein
VEILVRHLRHGRLAFVLTDAVEALAERLHGPVAGERWAEALALALVAAALQAAGIAVSELIRVGTKRVWEGCGRYSGQVCWGGEGLGSCNPGDRGDDAILQQRPGSQQTFYRGAKRGHVCVWGRRDAQGPVRGHETRARRMYT